MSLVFFSLYDIISMNYYKKSWVNMENKLSRFKAREQGFILVFEKIFNEDDLNTIIENAEISRDVKFDDYAKEIAFGVYENIDVIDELISSFLKKGWSIKRISKPSLAILRLAVFEIKYNDDIPSGVAVNEAVELAKKYTVDESRFINGVLGAIVKN